MPYVPESVREEAARNGLYRPELEHDACGVGFIAHMRGEPTHTLISQALTILENLGHRGAEGSDPLTGDGAGILLQIPHELFAQECLKIGVELPDRVGAYGVGMIFLPSDAALRTFFLWLLEPDEARGQLQRERDYWQGVLDEFLRIREEPTGTNKKARTLRIALEGGIRTVEARLAWLDDALAEIASDAWRRLPPG